MNFSNVFRNLEPLQHHNPIGSGLGQEAIVEAAGPDCIVPGQAAPIKLLGLKVLFSKNSSFVFLFCAYLRDYALKAAIFIFNRLSICYYFLFLFWDGMD